MLFFRIVLTGIVNVITGFGRHLYWLFRLSRASIGGDFRLKWPVKIEGKGKLIIGAHSFLGKKVHLGCSQQSSFKAGSHFYIGDNVTLMLKTGIQFQLGNKVTIESYSRVYIQNNWVWGNNVKIATYCQLFSREKDLHGLLNIGDGSYIGDNSIVDVSDDVIIGKEVAIGPLCIIYTHDHDYRNKNLAAWKSPADTQKVIIEDGVWIGSRVTILPGVKVGRRAVIATGAVVTKNVPPETVWGGVPAKQLKVIS